MAQYRIDGDVAPIRVRPVAKRVKSLADLDLKARGYLVDLDGTLMSGGRPLAWAQDLLAAIEGRFVIVSNDAEHTSLQLAAQIQPFGGTQPAQYRPRRRICYSQAGE